MTDSIRDMDFPRQEKTLRVYLPNDIGYVEIRVDKVNEPTSYLIVAAEMVSLSSDTPAADGLLYVQQFNHLRNTVYMVGRPAGEPRQ